MATLTDADKKRIEAQVRSAYQRPPYFAAGVSTRKQANALNARIRVAMYHAFAERDAIADRLVETLATDVAPVMKRTVQRLIADRIVLEHARKAERLATDLRKYKSEPVAETTQAIRAHLAKRPEILRDVREDISRTVGKENVDWLELRASIPAALALQHYTATKALHTVPISKTLLEVADLLLAGTLYKSTGAAPLDAFDWFTARTIIAQYPEVGEAIQERTNMITLPGFTSSMFEEVRDEFRDQLYLRAAGGKGAEALASELSNKLLAVDPNIPKSKFMLWARTEGAVVQNDAMMKLGERGGLNGKQWYAILDEVTRDAHVLNHNAGVIPMSATFPDGSTDGGSGSKSPFNCRCAVGPALLPGSIPRLAIPDDDEEPAKAPPVGPPPSVAPVAPAKPKPAPVAKPKTPKAPKVKQTPTPKAPTKISPAKPQRTVQPPTSRQDFVDAVADFQAALTPAQLDALEYYTSTAHTDMNAYLRGTYTKDNAVRSIEWVREKNTHMLSIFDDAPVFAKDAQVYRGVPLDPQTTWGRAQLEAFKSGRAVGAYVEDLGFTSTSLERDVAQTFAGNKQSVLYVIDVPAGTPAVLASDLELEVLLRPGSRYLISDVVEAAPNRFTVYLKPDAELASAVQPTPFLRTAESPMLDYNTFDRARATAHSSMSAEAKAALDRYLSRDNTYEDMNNMLRYGKVSNPFYKEEKLQAIRDANATLRAEIQASTGLQEDSLLFRGAYWKDENDPEIAQLLGALKERRAVGTVISDEGFMSTTVDQSRALTYGSFTAGETTYAKPGVSILYEIDAPKGTKFVYGTTFERELILEPGAKYRITNVLETAPNEYVLRVVPE